MGQRIADIPEEVRESEAIGWPVRSPNGLRSRWSKDDWELDRMAAAGRIVWEVLELVRDRLKPGTTTHELDQRAERLIRARGGEPTFLGYHEYPAAICASPNSLVVHGIPNRERLKRGDILSVDVGVTKDEYVADAAATFAVGEISDAAERIMEVCRTALWAGIANAVPGKHIGDISHAVQKTTESRGYSVIKTLVGHGVGRKMHEPPQVPNYGSPKSGELVQSGMTLAIEPMITAGDSDVFVSDDGWSIWTADGSLSAHFEHTVAATTDGPMVLTAESPILVTDEVLARESVAFAMDDATPVAR